MLMQVKDGRSVAVSLPHNDGVGQTTYKVEITYSVSSFKLQIRSCTPVCFLQGNTEPAPPKDCVLIIDHETGELTLERWQIQYQDQSVRNQGGND